MSQSVLLLLILRYEYIGLLKMLLNNPVFKNSSAVIEKLV